MWSSTTPSAGSAARAAADTAAIAAGSGPPAPVAEVSSGDTGPRTGPAVDFVPCVALIACLPVTGSSGSGSGHPLVGREREEVRALVGQRHLGDQRAGVVPPAAGQVAAARLGDLLHPLAGEPLAQLPGDGVPAGQPHPVVQPLPDLAAADLGGGGVLHE